MLTSINAHDCLTCSRDSSQVRLLQVRAATYTAAVYTAASLIQGLGPVTCHAAPL